MSKIFGLGLSKTGTSSLHKALQILGYKSVHEPGRDRRTIEEFERGQYKLSILKDHDALLDVPGCIMYPQFDKEYPGSKYILTIRDMKKWHTSMEAHFGRRNRDGGFRRFCRAAVYGCIDYNYDRMDYVYRKHSRDVQQYFKGSGSLLLMNICAGDGWDVLCPFLGKAIPDVPFPHANKKPAK